MTDDFTFTADTIPYKKTNGRWKGNVKAQKTRYYAKHPERYSPARSFCGVDGEGGNIPDPNVLPGMGTIHAYLLLRAGDQVLETGKPLSWADCFEFLSHLPNDRIYVGYFFDYDVNMMLRQLSKERYARIYNRHLRAHTGAPNGVLPVDVGDYQVDYLPHKEFRVKHRTSKHWTIISDVGQFFQSTFLSTLEKWGIGTADERAEIARGKSERINFAEITPETRHYNQLECRLLEQLMDDFRSVCKDTGYVPAKYQGPGYLATAMLRHHGVPKRESIPILTNETFKALANEGYYGGRFETTAAGPIHGPIWQYDINSAYPSALKGLPCLLHGTWTQVKKRPDSGLYFGKVSFHHGGFRYLHNLPIRTKQGNIYYPRDGIGVYWSNELNAAERAGTKILFHRGWAYSAHCDCRWFDFMDEYYQRRLEYGKTTKGFVLKLAGNSIYGKIAQSIGYAPFANPVWAGLITATCRAQIIDAYSQAPRDTYMIATDGIFCGKQLDLPVSNRLGEWEETLHSDGMFIVQPGVYFVGDSAKTRGVERGRIWRMRSEFEDAWKRFYESNGLHHTISVQVDNFLTCSQAQARGKWDIAGTWERTEREISFDWSIKRKRIMARIERCGLRTLPHDGSPETESVPYQRIIGGGLKIPDSERYGPMLQEAVETAEQPDWVETLF